MEDQLSALAAGMRRRFGNRAEEVARSQADNSSGAVAETWRSILKALESTWKVDEKRSAPPNGGKPPAAGDL